MGNLKFVKSNAPVSKALAAKGGVTAQGVVGDILRWTETATQDEVDRAATDVSVEMTPVVVADPEYKLIMRSGNTFIADLGLFSKANAQVSAKNAEMWAKQALAKLRGMRSQSRQLTMQAKQRALKSLKFEIKARPPVVGDYVYDRKNGNYGKVESVDGETATVVTVGGTGPYMKIGTRYQQTVQVLDPFTMRPPTYTSGTSVVVDGGDLDYRIYDRMSPSDQSRVAGRIIGQPLVEDREWVYPVRFSYTDRNGQAQTTDEYIRESTLRRGSKAVADKSDADPKVGNRIRITGNGELHGKLGKITAVHADENPLVIEFRIDGMREGSYHNVARRNEFQVVSSLLTRSVKDKSSKRGKPTKRGAKAAVVTAQQALAELAKHMQEAKAIDTEARRLYPIAERLIKLVETDQRRLTPDEDQVLTQADEAQNDLDFCLFGQGKQSAYDQFRTLVGEDGDDEYGNYRSYLDGFARSNKQGREMIASAKQRIAKAEQMANKLGLKAISVGSKVKALNEGVKGDNWRQAAIAKLTPSAMLHMRPSMIITNADILWRNITALQSEMDAGSFSKASRLHADLTQLLKAVVNDSGNDPLEPEYNDDIIDDYNALVDIRNSIKSFEKGKTLRVGSKVKALVDVFTYEGEIIEVLANDARLGQRYKMRYTEPAGTVKTMIVAEKALITDSPVADLPIGTPVTFQDHGRTIEGKIASASRLTATAEKAYSVRGLRNQNLGEFTHAQLTVKAK